jgi:5-methylcytosine-specific restriction enzyme A
MTATTRKRLSKRLKRQIWDAHSGCCCICGAPIGAKAWVAEHKVPLSMGGVDDASNMGPAHLGCARIKTSEEAPVRAKADRQRAVHVGAKAPRRPMPGSRASEWKKTFGKGWVKR